MKNRTLIAVFLVGFFSQAQTALYNSGNLRIHSNGQLGFHTNLINDNTFDQNQGLAGFYGANALNVSGAFVPQFFDVEVAVTNGLFLNTGLASENNTNFIVGDVVTPRNQPDVFYHFLQDAFFVGEGNATKIDGYAAVSGQQNFSFPVGDAVFLRPLILNATGTTPFAKAAYFFENPNSPTTFPAFDTERRPRTLGPVSTVEFWRLEGETSASISISWNERSNIAALNADVNTIIPVGWSKTGNIWVSLGVTARGGDLSQGFVTSENFVPDSYEIITFGSLATPEDILTLDNYIVTPNGDGINDELIIPELELSPNNNVRIFDRNGLLVFEMQNYTNEFNGFANTGSLVINREAGLPQGVYFYLVSLDDLGMDFQGFLYLSTK
ncbi:gliding motility-associated C-terminal domain-containing protein [Arenibacter sp. GZD96]|uniref:gliding motility-associated C-terminal domain-containing protein n=1 Tax=Aurantibrevibacter litoralis TaxID=3106030 RepID=UPI002AFE58F8|nr:gliding motility-associated C-terminal domain-containing protein [Arenibacter sp. GZD-96]MEA1786698.1 gliding motility-associated C-terminal domain-containing protein [Arenibacter sp. GZD-96]